MQFDRIRRREFITILGGAVTCPPEDRNAKAAQGFVNRDPSCRPQAAP